MNSPDDEERMRRGAPAGHERGGHDEHRGAPQPSGGAAPTSEWMKVMLEEIARKKAQAEQDRLEVERRLAENGRADRG